MRAIYEFSRRAAPSCALVTVIEAACWRARQLDELCQSPAPPRGAKAELARIRRSVRELVPLRAQRDRLLAITRSAT